MKKIRVFLVVLLSLHVSGCSIVSVGYNHADTYLRYSINSYATFNDAQKETIKHEVDIFMLWHRKNMLPEYVDFLQQLQRTAQSGEQLKREDATRFRIGVHALYVKIMQPTVRPAAKLLSRLDSAQIEELITSFDKANKKRREKLLGGSPDEQMRKRAERTIDTLENLVGGFSDEQLEKIRGMSNSLPPVSLIYINTREDNQAQMIALLKNKKNEEEIAAFIASWWLATDSTRSSDARSILRTFENATDEMIVSTYEILTDRQRKTLLSNIVKYIDIVHELAGKT